MDYYDMSYYDTEQAVAAIGGVQDAVKDYLRRAWRLTPVVDMDFDSMVGMLLALKTTIVMDFAGYPLKSDHLLDVSARLYHERHLTQQDGFKLLMSQEQRRAFGQRFFAEHPRALANGQAGDFDAYQTNFGRISFLTASVHPRDDGTAAIIGIACRPANPYVMRLIPIIKEWTPERFNSVAYMLLEKGFVPTPALTTVVLNNVQRPVAETEAVLEGVADGVE